jgi:hypothetical protein
LQIALRTSQKVGQYIFTHQDAVCWCVLFSSQHELKDFYGILIFFNQKLKLKVVWTQARALMGRAEDVESLTIVFMKTIGQNLRLEILRHCFKLMHLAFTYLPG